MVRILENRAIVERGQVVGLRSLPDSPPSGSAVGGRMRYLVLGSVEALADAEPVDLRRPRLRLLLALLLANANQPVAAEELRRSLWSSDEPSRPEPALREHVDALRVLLNLGDGRLSDVPGGYLLRVAPGELDVDDFTTLVQQARSLSAHDPRAAIDAYEAALRLWRGPAYDGLAGVDTLESSGRAFDDLRATALEELFEVLGSLGDTTTLVGRIQVATAEYPHREELTRLLMLALCRSGRRADALRAYSALRRQLADELGTEPSPALRELEQSILARDHFFERAAQADARAVAPARIELADIEAQRADPARSGISGVDVAIRSHTSLIGRLSELQQIEEQLDAVTLGRFRLVLVRGEAGIGKTRLLSELVDRNRNQFTSIVVPCSEHVTAPYITLARLFEQARSAADRNVARSFDALLDRLTMPAGTAANSMAGDAVNVARAQLMLEGVRALGALATVPTMIVIEDIQWADEATREFLEMLCAELTGRSGTSLLLVLTERTFETDGRARRLTDRYQRVPCTILNLRALGEVEIGELVRELGVSTPDRSLVETLSSVSSGNPLYVREALARISALDGFVKRDAKIATMIPDTALRPPAGLADLVDERLGATDADLRDLLQIAAVAGDELDAALLQRITGSDAETRLGRAAAVGLVTHTVEGWRFSHPLVRRVLYDDLDPARRRAIHATVGTALRELAACGHRVGAAELAFHLIHSGISDVDEGAVALLSDAGHQAYGLGAWSDAVLFFESGLTTGRCAGVDERVLAWMSYWAGLAHDRNYDIARATAHYHAAISWAREHREVELWGCCVLAEATMSNRRHAFTPPVVDAATVDLDEVLEQLGEDHAALRSRLLARYSAIDMSRARSADGLRRGEDAIRLARTSGDVLALENAFSSLGMASMSIGRATEACTSLREAQRHSNALRRPDLAGFATARLALSELMLGNLEEAAGASRAAGEAFGSVRHRSGECLVEAIEAALAVLRGDFKAAEAHGTASEARFRLSEYWFAPVVLYPALADARSMQGDDGGASDAIDAWKRSGQGGRGPVRLLVAARATRTAEAASILRDAERLMWFAAYPSMFATGFTGALAEGILALGRTDLAPRLLEGLQRRLDESVVLSPGLSHNGRRTAGLLLWSLGDVDEARSELEAAVEMSTTSRALPELVRAQTDLGRLLAASPSTDDRADAAPHLVAAASLATRLGMVRARSAAELALASATRATRADVVEGRESTVVMFTDIVGSTSISVNAGDVMYVRVVEEHHALVRRELGRTRGREVHTTGDGMLARFGSADDALRCAVRIQALLRRRSAMRPDPTLEVRIGLALGKPIERDGTLYGAVVNLAARLCAAADAGEILVDETCQRAVSDPALFAPRGAIALKGFRSPVITYAVTSIADRLRTLQA